jgi:hypothetical protein
MDVFLVTANGAESRSVDELPALLERGDGIVWVDIPGCGAWSPTTPDSSTSSATRQTASSAISTV